MKFFYDWERAKVLHAEGRLDLEIARELGCTSGAVAQWRWKNSLSCNTKRLSHDDQQQIEALLKEGKSCREIQEQTGIFRETIRKLGLRRGIAVPKAKRRFPDKTPGIIDKSGYILLRVDAGGPHANLIRHLGKNRTRGYALLHRMRMQDSLGRQLTDEEVVHHIDGDLYNNSIANLRLYESNGKHLADTLKGQVPDWTADGRERILAAVRGPRT